MTRNGVDLEVGLLGKLLSPSPRACVAYMGCFVSLAITTNNPKENKIRVGNMQNSAPIWVGLFSFKLKRPVHYCRSRFKQLTGCRRLLTGHSPFHLSIC